MRLRSSRTIANSKIMHMRSAWEESSGTVRFALNGLTAEGDWEVMLALLDFGTAILHKVVQRGGK